MVENIPTQTHSEKTHWAFFAKADGGDPLEFFELRRNGASLWQARGRPFTAGEDELREFHSEQEAIKAWDHLTNECAQQGFVCAFEGEYKPGTFDFDLLQKEIENGAREVFSKICKEQTGERITGFALYSDSEGMTICNAAMGERSFDDDDEDIDYFRTNPSEWPYESDTGLLLPYRMILFPSYFSLNIPFELEVPDFVDRFYESTVRALEKLDDENLFGVGEEREKFLLLFGDSDGGPTTSHVRRLNPPSVLARYAGCFDD